ncbi:unnamed protein product [Lathyrus sativus]|nr:unnamed protein product [Lathyrus sativus]
MAMTKTMLVVFFSALLVCSFFPQNVDAATIGYGAMRRDTISCNRKNPNSCKPVAVNPYTRGCEQANRCRGAN